MWLHVAVSVDWGSFLVWYIVITVGLGYDLAVSTNRESFLWESLE